MVDFPMRSLRAVSEPANYVIGLSRVHAADMIDPPRGL